MDTNVKIVLNDGNTLDAVGISFIHVDASNKDYIFYSLNELANGNMDKIYIAEASQNGTSPGPLSDDEWNNIKQIMLNISHNEPVSGISYKPLNGLSFNVGEAKKLAIKGDKKQAFIDAQNKAVAPTIATDEPAFVSDQAANGSPFFAAPVQDNGANAVQEVSVPSAFAMQPPVEQDIPVESLEGVSDVATTIEQSLTPTPVLIDTAVAPIQEVVPAVKTVVPEQPVEVAEQPVIESPAIETPVVQAETISAVPAMNGINSIEELETALNELQDGINKINLYINSLKNKNTVVVNTTQVQTVSTGQTPVATESMNIAEQPELVTDSLEEEAKLTNDSIPGVEDISPLENTNVSSVIDTSIDTSTSNILDTSVSSSVDESVTVTPIANIEPTVGEEIGEPAFSLDPNAVNQPQTIVLDPNAIPAPNSANSINTSTVEMNIPEAPVVTESTPQIPISPLEQSGIPVAPVIATPVEIQQPVQVVQPVEQVAVPQVIAQPPVEPTPAASVPEITVPPVQQVPTVDLSAINTSVTLPTDMKSNPTPSGVQEGVFGPASLDVQTEQ